MDKAFEEYLKAGQTTISNLVLYNYPMLGLNETEMILIIQIMSATQSGDSFPEIELIAKRMGKNEADVYQAMHSLIQKNVMEIASIQDETGIKHDVYQFKKLFDKLIIMEQQKQKSLENKDLKTAQEKVFQSIEVEFGRPLSPIEIETVNLWLHKDNYLPELILLALREAVLNQAYSLKYIDRILLSWERQNIRSAQDVQREQQRKRIKTQDSSSSQSRMKSDPDKPSIPLYHWSNSNNKKEE
ncbi:DnaD domain protein [Liquorilactobacillus mali]|uniref:DNA replication protein dnaD n=1 Tax=Liquorilactobacillus mali TaxID=1618 RepID=A0A0R2G4V6_9LACO|nr:DnaD domain protein [Liquorilactobacillus mali]KRN33189.1 DNA replication protein dnaD [Liquorilactobacillus mali]MDN7144996.1 DnaD domain protein [Liquorilactobacillus mali]